ARRPDAGSEHPRSGGGRERLLGGLRRRRARVGVLRAPAHRGAPSPRALPDPAPPLGRRVSRETRRGKDHRRGLSVVHRLGTRYGSRRDRDGLIAAGGPGTRLTWMDAKVDDWVVTPRIGKPVEVEALWLNALRIGGATSARWNEVFERGLRAFGERFWNDSLGCLHDVVDPDHREGAADPTFRPNQ